MKRKPVAVVDSEQTYKDSKGFTRLTVVKRCDTVAEAEAFVAEREKVEPDKVHRGAYGIDGPEQGD